MVRHACDQSSTWATGSAQLCLQLPSAAVCACPGKDRSRRRCSSLANVSLTQSMSIALCLKAMGGSGLAHQVHTRYNPILRHFITIAGVVLPMALRGGGRHPPAPQVSYTVKTNTSSARVLCKGCRNPIAMHSMQIGHGDRHQMRWYHLGCLSHDRWREAAMPGRLTGVPSLHPSQQVSICSGDTFLAVEDACMMFCSALCLRDGLDLQRQV